MAVGTWYDTVDPSLFSRQEGARMGSQVGNQIANTRASFARDAQSQDLKDRTRMAIEDVAAYANSPEGHAADEMTFQVNLLKVLNNHGAQPGPIFNRLLEIKRADVKARKEKAQAQEQAQSLAGAMVPELNPDAYNAPTQQTPEGNDFTPLADSEQAAQVFGADSAQQDNRRAYMTGLASLAPDKFAGALVEQALKPGKDETPNWDSDRGVYVYPSGRTVRPQGIEPKSKPVTPETPDQIAEARGREAAIARAQGIPLDPAQTVDADAWDFKHGKVNRPATSPQGWMIDPEGRPYRIVDNEIVRPNAVEAIPTKPEPREPQPQRPFEVQGETGVAQYDPATGKLLRVLPYPGGPKRSGQAGSTPTLTPDQDKKLTIRAQGILDGKVGPEYFPKRGAAREMLIDKIFQLDPNADVVGLEAGAAVRKKTEQGVRLLDSLVKPQGNQPALVDQLLAAHKALGFGNSPLLNRAKREVLEQTGSGALKLFDNLRNSMVFEAGNALAGGAPTDQRIKMELENWSANPSRKQVEAAVVALKEIAAARTAAYGKRGAGETPTEPKERRFTILGVQKGP